MGRYRNNPRSGSNNNNNNNGILIRLLGYALTAFVIPFILNMIRKKLSDQQRLRCNKCHGKLQVIDKEGNLYCKNCKMIKMDRH
jgi:late competence protein required for DNA uptake (superfamily II DNA/RNA helicase)